MTGVQTCALPISLSGFIVVVAHVIQDAIQGLAIGEAVDSLIGLVILTAYGLNERGRHLAAKTVLMTFINFALAAYCSVIPKHNGVFLFYFPMMGLSSVVFDSRHRTLGHFFVGLSAVLLFALVMTDFKLLGDVQIQASPFLKCFTALMNNPPALVWDYMS